MKKLFISLLGFFFLLSGCNSQINSTKSRLDLIINRNKLICGISGTIPGFSFLDTNRTYKGIDVDICRAFSAAFLGNPELIEYRTLTAAERFTALKAGEIDVLSRNTTKNLTRDSEGGNGITFSPVIFHDGQALMVRKNDDITNIFDLKDKTICVGSGTTSEQNINDTFESLSLPYKPLKYQDLNQVRGGYLQQRCSAMTSDRSQLAAVRSSFSNKDEHVILDDILSKEPLAPASVGDDDKLADAMRWVVYSLIEAEERGITKSNILEKLEMAKNNKELKLLRRFLGIEGDLGEKLGLKNDFVVNVISAVGNYGEIYERHLGINSDVSIPRGLNKLYKNNGLLISPPFN